MLSSAGRGCREAVFEASVSHRCSHSNILRISLWSKLDSVMLIRFEFLRGTPPSRSSLSLPEVEWCQWELCAFLWIQRRNKLSGSSGMFAKGTCSCSVTFEADALPRFSGELDSSNSRRSSHCRDEKNLRPYSMWRGPPCYELIILRRDETN